MAKRDKYIKKRSSFCQLAIKDQKKAACELRLLATGLENCRNTSDVINALSEIYLVHEKTILRDLIR